MIETDLSTISGVLNGKVVLVTGGVHRIGTLPPDRSLPSGPAGHARPGRIGVARGTAEHHGPRALLEGDDLVLADIRDTDRLDEIFGHVRPDVVFHAAALKHLSLLEKYPKEAWKTNVVGTLNVLRAAQTYGVGTFINISTDKAANPICVLGYSKRITERLTATVGREYGHLRQCAVRKRAGQPWLHAGDVPGPDRCRWTGDSHPP